MEPLGLAYAQDRRATVGAAADAEVRVMLEVLQELEVDQLQQRAELDPDPWVMAGEPDPDRGSPKFGIQPVRERQPAINGGQRQAPDVRPGPDGRQERALPRFAMLRMPRPAHNVRPQVAERNHDGNREHADDDATHEGSVCSQQ